MRPLLSIGVLARRAGITVRTLHHYDEIGLLPARRTEAGHRRYGDLEVERLLYITALRALGLRLEDVRSALDAPDFDPAATVAQRRAALDLEADRLATLGKRLAALEDAIRHRATTGAPVAPDTFLALTLAMNEIEQHYTPDQLQALSERREALGPDAIRAVEAEWPRLFDALGAALEAGTDPSDPTVQSLVARWDELVAMFTGGDAGIQQSLGSVWQESGDAASGMGGVEPGQMRALFAYAERARSARG